MYDGILRHNDRIDDIPIESYVVRTKSTVLRRILRCDTEFRKNLLIPRHNQRSNILYNWSSVFRRRRILYWNVESFPLIFFSWITAKKFRFRFRLSHLNEIIYAQNLPNFRIDIQIRLMRSFIHRLSFSFFFSQQQLNNRNPIFF